MIATDAVIWSDIFILNLKFLLSLFIYFTWLPVSLLVFSIFLFVSSAT